MSSIPVLKWPLNIGVLGISHENVNYMTREISNCFAFGGQIRDDGKSLRYICPEEMVDPLIQKSTPCWVQVEASLSCALGVEKVASAVQIFLFPNISSTEGRLAYNLTTGEDVVKREISKLERVLLEHLNLSH